MQRCTLGEQSVPMYDEYLNTSKLTIHLSALVQFTVMIKARLIFTIKSLSFIDIYTIC